MELEGASSFQRISIRRKTIAPLTDRGTGSGGDLSRKEERNSKYFFNVDDENLVLDHDSVTILTRLNADLSRFSGGRPATVFPLVGYLATIQRREARAHKASHQRPKDSASRHLLSKLTEAGSAQ
jgi:hypothetical protein